MTTTGIEISNVWSTNESVGVKTLEHIADLVMEKIQLQNRIDELKSENEQLTQEIEDLRAEGCEGHE